MSEQTYIDFQAAMQKLAKWYKSQQTPEYVVALVHSIAGGGIAGKVSYLIQLRVKQLRVSATHKGITRANNLQQKIDTLIAEIKKSLEHNAFLISTLSDMLIRLDGKTFDAQDVGKSTEIQKFSRYIIQEFLQLLEELVTQLKVNFSLEEARHIFRRAKRDAIPTALYFTVFLSPIKKTTLPDTFVALIATSRIGLRL